MKPLYALTANLSKANAAALARKAAAFLAARGQAILVEEELARAIKVSCGVRVASLEEIFARAQRLIVLGGDGTILHLVRAMSRRQIPILGINLGGLGFLTEVKARDWKKALSALVEGLFTVEKRMTLEAIVWRGKTKIATHFALNDIVVTNGALARVIHLEVEVNKEIVASYMSDGLIVSTPTGSTAYSLSSGGPIVHPATRAILVTPICPHTLSNRPIVIPEDQTVKIKVGVPKDDVMLTIDGQVSSALNLNDLVDVKKSSNEAKLIQLGKVSYFQILSEKLNWGKFPAPKSLS